MAEPFDPVADALGQLGLQANDPSQMPVVPPPVLPPALQQVLAQQPQMPHAPPVQMPPAALPPYANLSHPQQQLMAIAALGALLGGAKAGPGGAARRLAGRWR